MTGPPVNDTSLIQYMHGFHSLQRGFAVFLLSPSMQVHECYFKTHHSDPTM
jgi:hypothetical protein